MIFALLALALVRLHRRAIVPRILNVSCAAGSLAMNVLAADLTSPRSMAIYALPSALYATASDQLIAVVRRHALPAKVDEEEQRSAWAMAWRAVVRVTCLITLVIAWVLRTAAVPDPDDRRARRDLRRAAAAGAGPDPAARDPRAPAGAVTRRRAAAGPAAEERRPGRTAGARAGRPRSPSC